LRADRLLSLLMLLQARGRMTAQELSKELEVSERTIYRTLRPLGVSGVPVYAERGQAAAAPCSIVTARTSRDWIRTKCASCSC